MTHSTRSIDGRRPFALAAMALLVAAMLPVGAAASSPTHPSPASGRPTVRRLTPPAGATIDHALLASLRSTDRPVMVILQLGGAPVATLRTTADRRLSGADATTARKPLAAAQAAILPRITAMGGRVIGTMVDAYDGIQVLAPSKAVTRLAALPGVIAVHPVTTFARENVHAVPYVRGPGAWAAGETGSGETIGIIDTGIDFYHADFGGTGSVADFTYGQAHDTTVPAHDHDGITVAFPNAKVIGGTDFAGDAYDADNPVHATPVPDGNPLDCGTASGGDGHGTHTAGTAAGDGVLSNGTTFSGPYDASTFTSHTFLVGPGVAPQATIREYRVFGCSGSSALVTLAVNQAVADGVDVISLSLGSAYGTASTDDPTVAAIDTAAADGIVVVAASGNDGQKAYLTSTPASAAGAISVAAMDASGPGSTFQEPAVFSSVGPRIGDSGLKPDIMAPGVNLVSAGVGTGTGGADFSGTSMATPVVAGAAALALEGHPGWTNPSTRAGLARAALMNTADINEDAHGSLIIDPFRIGAGVVDASAASAATVLATTADGTQALAFGYQPMAGAFSATKTFTVHDYGATSETYDLADTGAEPLGLGAAVTINHGTLTVTVPAGGSVSIDVQISLNADKVAVLPTADTGGSGTMTTIGGHVTLLPHTPSAGVGELEIPYTLVPRGTSDVGVQTRSAYQSDDTLAVASTVLDNGSRHPGTADIYAWGLSSPDQMPGSGADVRAVGVQDLSGAYLGGQPSDRSLVFAISTYSPVSTAADDFYEIDITPAGASTPDHAILAGDFGVLTTGEPEGELAAVALDSGGNPVGPYFAANAPPNGSVVELPVLASTLGLGSGHSTFTYTVTATDGQTGETDVVPGTGTFDPYVPAISSGDYLPLGDHAAASLDLVVDTQLILAEPALGWLLVALDDPDGAAAADELPLGTMAHRLSGSDRYGTAATISRYTFAPGVAAAFVVSGANFPDGLAAGPAAAALGAPILLVPSAGRRAGRGPGRAAAAAAGQIYVAGGTGAVSAGIVTTLQSVAPVQRLFGADRYATAAAIDTTIFKTVLGKASLPVVYVADGALFPDALSGGPAAAHQHGALLLVPPTGTLPTSVTDALTALAPAKIVVVGGTVSVSAGVQAQLTLFAPMVVREAGVDRYATSVVVSQYAFAIAGVPAVYLAAGTNFPDAMGGAAAAGFTDGPILLVGPNFYEVETRTEMVRLAPHALFILGGEASIDDGVVDVFSPLIGPRSGRTRSPVRHIPLRSGRRDLPELRHGKAAPFLARLDAALARPEPRPAPSATSPEFSSRPPR